MNAKQPPLSASSIAKMKLMAADHELSQALVKVIFADYYIVDILTQSVLIKVALKLASTFFLLLFVAYIGTDMAYVF